jgi:ATP-binding cassette subfamily B multidrug efflux pump
MKKSCTTGIDYMQTSVIRQYSQTLKQHWVVYFLGTICLMLTSVSEMIIPKFIQWSLDVVGGQNNPRADPWAVYSAKESLGFYGLALLGAMGLGFVGRVGWRHLLARRTHEAGFQMKVDFWDALRYQPLKIFERYSLGDLMNRATGDWQSARIIHGFTLVLTLDLIFFTLFALVMMFTIDPYLSLLSILVFPFLPKPIIGLARKEHDYHLEAQEKLSDLSQGVTEILASIRFHRATDSENTKIAAMKQQAEIYSNARIKVVKTGWKIYPLGALPTLVAYSILLSFGIWEVACGRISLGAFVALQSYVLMLQGPLLELGDCIAEWQKGFASLGRIQEIISLGRRSSPLGSGRSSEVIRRVQDISPVKIPVMPVDVPSQKAALAGIHLELRRVFFRYDGAHQNALHDCSLHLNPGEKVGITGPIGGGKSTLLKICAHLLEPNGGMVLFGEKPLGSLDHQWIRDQVTLVTQKSFLFASTIRSNLNLNYEFDEERLWDVLSQVCLADDVRRLPLKLDSILGESGTNLSGGQRQRLALARALLRLKPLVLLDDALSAVDARTEHEILMHLETLLKNQTVLWVAHRSGTLSLCQRIYRMDRGHLTPHPSSN